MLRRRKPDAPGRQFPARLLAEAERQPNGWVYEIAPGIDPVGEVPPEAIVGAWAVGPDGKPTGAFTPNPNYDGPPPPR